MGKKGGASKAAARPNASLLKPKKRSNVTQENFLRHFIAFGEVWGRFENFDFFDFLVVRNLLGGVGSAGASALGPIEFTKRRPSENKIFQE